MTGQLTASDMTSEAVLSVPDFFAAAAALGIVRWHVSLCHEDGWAAALAVAERSPATSGSTQRYEGNHDA